MVDCAAAKDALLTTTPELCKVNTTDAEEWGCTAAANCTAGVYDLAKDTAKVALSFTDKKYEAKFLKTATCNVGTKDTFVTAAAGDSSSGETKKDKAADDKAAGEDKKDIAYLFGVAAIAMLW